MKKYNIEKDIKYLVENGVIFNEWIDVEDDFYHGSPGISASGLKTISSTSPEVLRYEKTHEKDRTPALILGSAIHKFILENEKFNDEYLIAPSNRKTDREYKIFINSHKEEIDEGKIVLTKRDGETLEGILLSLKDGSTKGGNNTYSGIINNKDTLIEKALYTIDRERNIIMKVKIDINMSGMLLDLKSTKSAVVDKFMRDAANLGYGIQAAFYRKITELAGKDSNMFGFVAVEKTPPYVHSVIIMEELDVALEYAKVETLLDQYSACLNNDIWYGPNGFNPITGLEPLFVMAGMPKYHRYALEEAIDFKSPQE